MTPAEVAVAVLAGERYRVHHSMHDPGQFVAQRLRPWTPTDRGDGAGRDFRHGIWDAGGHVSVWRRPEPWLDYCWQVRIIYGSHVGADCTASGTAETLAEAKAVADNLVSAWVVASVEAGLLRGEEPSRQVPLMARSP